MGQVNQMVMQQFMHLRGDIAEMGVNRGSSSKGMITMAQVHKKVIWLYDSFKGMPSSHEPTDLEQYPQGRFGNASADAILDISDYKRLRVVAGWLPESMMNITVRYCFVYLDLDHYEGTIHTLKCLWHRIILGGGVLCDDWFPQRPKILATRAIKEFVASVEDLEMVEYPARNQVLLVKRS